MTVIVDGTSGITTNSGTVVSTTDATISGLTVGKGGGADASSTVVGSGALASNSSGARNTAMGNSALASNVSGVDNTAIGSVALYSNTGSTNTAVGRAALYTNSSGGSNTAMGYGALQLNTTASNNTAVGYQAGYTNTTGIQHVFIGTQAGYSSTGNSQTFVGNQAGYSVTSGSNNTFVGQYSGQAATTGSSNAFFGQGAGYLVTTGSKNTILGGYSGNQGGLDIRTASNYIVLSDGDGNPRMWSDGSGNWQMGVSPAAGTDGFTFSSIGHYSAIYHPSGTASGTAFTYFDYNAGAIGSITQNGTTGVLYNLTSDYRLKNNQEALTGANDFIMALKPKKWQWWDGSGEGVGFVAHEFMEVAKYSGHGEKDAVDENGKPIYQSIQPSSSEVMANLVSFVQELKTIVDTQAAEIAELKAKG